MKLIDFKIFCIVLSIFIILIGLTSCSKKLCPQAYNKSTYIKGYSRVTQLN